MKKYLMRLDDIEKARKVFCDAKCKICPISSFNNSTGMECDNFTAVYPDKAAELMGLEVVEVEDKLRLTEQELAICKTLGAKWVTRGGERFSEDSVQLWCGTPVLTWKEPTDIEGKPLYLLAGVSPDLFPSIKNGDCVNVEEILKEADI